MTYPIWSKYVVLRSLIALVLLTMPTTAQAQLEKEQVMTALLYNVARFVTWPESSFADRDAPLVIALQGKGPLQREIAGLNGKQIEGRTIVIQHLAPTQLPNRQSPCHILYIPPSNAQRLSFLLNSLAHKPILTVSDMREFTHKGGILHLEGAQNVSFSLNLDRTEQAGLVISSKLFRLAKEVIKDGQVREGP